MAVVRSAQRGRRPGSRRDGGDRYKWTALANTTAAMFMSALDGSIVLIALPSIFNGIHLDPLASGNIAYLLWMIMGYRLVQAVLVVTVGRLGDMFGRVRIYNGGFAVFTVASILLSFDPLVGTHAAMWLIGWRLVQAAGGSMLQANSAAILTDAFPTEQRGFALGINQVAGLGGQFIGLVAGWAAGRVGLAGGVLGQRAGRCLLHRLGLSDPAGRRTSATGWHRLVGQRDLRGRAERSTDRDDLRFAAVRRPHHGLDQPGGDHPGDRWSGAVGGVRAHRESGQRTDDRAAVVPDTSVHRRQRGRVVDLHRARRHAVRAHHLVAGRLASPARLRLQPDTAVGRHLHAAAHRRLPGRRPRVRLPVRPARLPRPVHRRRRAVRGQFRGSDVRADQLLVLGLRAAHRGQRHRLGHVRLPELVVHHGQRPGPPAWCRVRHARHVPEFREPPSRSRCSSH